MRIVTRPEDIYDAKAVVAKRQSYWSAFTRRSYMCFVVKLHYVIVLCGAERVRTISHESLQCLCFERRSQSRCSQKLAQKTLLDGQNFWIGARPASGRGGSAHRLRSGLRPRQRGADCHSASSAEAVRKQCGSSAEAVRKSCGSSAEVMRNGCGGNSEKLRKSCGGNAE